MAATHLSFPDQTLNSAYQELPEPAKESMLSKLINQGIASNSLPYKNPIPIFPLDIANELKKPDSPYKKLMFAMINEAALIDSIIEENQLFELRETLKKEAKKEGIIAEKQATSSPRPPEQAESHTEEEQPKSVAPYEQTQIFEAYQELNLDLEIVKQELYNQSVLPNAINDATNTYIDEIEALMQNDALDAKDKADLIELKELAEDIKQKYHPNNIPKMINKLNKEMQKGEGLSPKEAESQAQKKIPLNAQLQAAFIKKGLLGKEDKAKGNEITDNYAKKATDTVNGVFKNAENDAYKHAAAGIEQKIIENKKMANEINAKYIANQMQAHKPKPSAHHKDVNRLVKNQSYILLTKANTQMQKHVDNANIQMEKLLDGESKLPAECLQDCVQLMDFLSKMQSGKYGFSQDGNIINNETGEDLSQTYDEILTRAQKSSQHLNDDFFVNKIDRASLLKDIEHAVRNQQEPPQEPNLSSGLSR